MKQEIFIMLLENKEKRGKEMNKKFVTLLSVAVLSTVASGVYADEITLGGNVASTEDNAGLVVEEKPAETQPSVSTESPATELGKDVEKEEKDNTGVVVEEKTPSEQPKEEKPKEDKPSVEDTPEIKEQKQKAEENVGVKETDDPKPLNVTKEEIQEQPIETNTGHKVVSTNQSKVVVETETGDYQEKEPYEVGAVKQQDGTIALKDKEGKLKVLPATGTASTIFATIWGFVGLVATVWGKRKFN